MGAGVSTEGAPLTRVKCKDNIGVLFDPEAEKAAAAAPVRTTSSPSHGPTSTRT